MCSICNSPKCEQLLEIIEKSRLLVEEGNLDSRQVGRQAREGRSVVEVSFWTIGSHPTMIGSPEGPVVLSGDSFGCYNWRGATGEQRSGMLLNILKCTGQPPPQRLIQPKM